MDIQISGLPSFLRALAHFKEAMDDCVKANREQQEAEERFKGVQMRIEAIEARFTNLQIRSRETVVEVTINEMQ